MHPYYVQQLFNQLNAQSVKLQQLEKLVRELQSDINNLKNNSSSNIGPINYHFEQLKIEKLEGTLNIGITPGEENGLNEVLVNGQPLGKKPDEERTALLARISHLVAGYMQQEAPERLLQMAGERNLSINESHLQMVTADLQRQMDGRIQDYLAQLPTERPRRGTDDEICISIMEQIKLDIDTALRQHVELEYEVKAGK